jgi:hypothetical protein
MKNIEKLQQAKKQHDELESIRLKASNLLVNEKYDTCVHFHYENKIVISCAAKTDKGSIWAQFDLINGEISVTARGNYKDAEIEAMTLFIERWLCE